MALNNGVNVCGPGVPFSKIGEAIQHCANSHGYEVSDVFGGHGIGEELLMPPYVSHVKNTSSSEGEATTGAVMKPGMIFTIEPVLHMYEDMNYYLLNDGFSVHAKGNPSCQW